MVMYDPAAANIYRDVKVARWKRARDEAQKNDISRLLAASAETAPSPFAAADAAPVGGGAIPLGLSAEELHQRRVRQSAALGITTAVKLERDEIEAAHKAKVAAGAHRKGRIGERLEKLKSALAAKDGASDNSAAAADSAQGGGNSSLLSSSSLGEVTTCALSSPAATMSGSLAGSSAPLVFQKSELAAGGYVVREDTSATERRKANPGKPSSTILIRFAWNGPPIELFDDVNNNNNSNNSNNANTAANVAARNAFLEGIQDVCGQCGVVRAVRYVVLSHQERASVRSRLEKDESSASVDIETRMRREMVRVLVRFDTVANAFKALETLRQKYGSNWDVCFFPTQLFDAGSLGPSEKETLCSTGE